MIKYRQDVDGLRSLAILPVLFFHLGAISLFPGGFVGVDVFFVISGYLITKIIYDDLSNGRYSIARFYERRIRRISDSIALGVPVTVVGPSVEYRLPLPKMLAQAWPDDSVWAGQHIPLLFEGGLTTQASRLIVAQVAPQFWFR